MLFGETVAVYCEFCVAANGTYSSHCGENKMKHPEDQVGVPLMI
jgi:hypothetical protein